MHGLLRVSSKRCTDAFYLWKCTRLSTPHMVSRPCRHTAPPVSQQIDQFKSRMNSQVPNLDACSAHISTHKWEVTSLRGWAWWIVCNRRQNMLHRLFFICYRGYSWILSTVHANFRHHDNDLQRNFSESIELNMFTVHVLAPKTLLHKKKRSQSTILVPLKIWPRHRRKQEHRVPGCATF